MESIMGMYGTDRFDEFDDDLEDVLATLDCEVEERVKHLIVSLEREEKINHVLNS